VAQTDDNKKTVRTFLELAFNEKRPADAVVECVGRTYRQHNPKAADGPVAFIQFVLGFVGQFPEVNFEIQRLVAEGDLVVVHSHLKTSPQDRGSAVIDIYRMEDGKIVEHWDAMQEVPETSANDNTMF
jgi:predicted SnoaL-like aldol condensation-catalyzing enzyme